MTDRHPRTIGNRYRLEERVGSGGMGEVWRAVDTRSGTTVAVKLMHAHVRDAEHAQRFRRERRVRLDSPYVVEVLDGGIDADDQFLVMEYVDGETLAARIARGQLSTDDTRRIAAQIAQGLAAAHAHGVIHRDVKPGNILLTADGDAKLSDFGIARVTDATAFTEIGTFLGAARYSAPEAFGGHVDERSDLYSLGVVIYEMLTGEPPFDGETPLALMELHRNAEPPRMAEIARLDPSLVAVVARLLTKDPRDRISDAGQLAATIEHADGSGDATRKMRPRRLQTRRVGTRRPHRLQAPAIQRWHVAAAVTTTVVAVGVLVASVAMTRESSGGASANAPQSSPTAPAATALAQVPGQTVLVPPSDAVAPDGTIDRIEGLPESARAGEMDKLFGSVPLPGGAAELTRGIEFGHGAVPLDCPFRSPFSEQEFSRWMSEVISYETGSTLDEAFAFYVRDTPGRWPLFQVQEFPSFSATPVSSVLEPESINVSWRKDNMIVRADTRDNGLRIRRCVVEPTPIDQWVPVQSPNELEAAFDDIKAYPGARPSYYEWGGSYCPVTKRSVDKTSYSIAASVDEIAAFYASQTPPGWTATGPVRSRGSLSWSKGDLTVVIVPTTSTNSERNGAYHQHCVG